MSSVAEDQWTYTISNVDGTNTKEIVAEATFTSTGTSTLVVDIGQLSPWFFESRHQKSAEEIMMELEPRIRELNNVIDPNYEPRGPQTKMQHTSRRVRKYYHLYKHRSF